MRYDNSASAGWAAHNQDWLTCTVWCSNFRSGKVVFNHVVAMRSPGQIPVMCRRQHSMRCRCQAAAGWPSAMQKPNTCSKVKKAAGRVCSVSPMSAAGVCRLDCCCGMCSRLPKPTSKVTCKISIQCFTEAYQDKMVMQPQCIMMCCELMRTTAQRCSTAW